jgi:uncharacterized protein (DUF924 family)
MLHRSTGEAASVVTFWTEAGMQRWFTKDAAFDREFRETFLALHERAARGDFDEAWTKDAESALALVLLLDQFPRNAFRGSARAFATDAHARRVADVAIAAGLDALVPKTLRPFFYLPFEHSESMADQERSVALNEAIGMPEWALKHRAIIQRFGRFPHRNAVLGRETTAEEQAFLDGGGFAG